MRHRSFQDGKRHPRPPDWRRSAARLHRVRAGAVEDVRQRRTLRRGGVPGRRARACATPADGGALRAPVRPDVAASRCPPREARSRSRSASAWHRPTRSSTVDTLLAAADAAMYRAKAGRQEPGRLRTRHRRDDSGVARPAIDAAQDLPADASGPDAGRRFRRRAVRPGVRPARTRGALVETARPVVPGRRGSRRPREVFDNDTKLVGPVFRVRHVAGRTGSPGPARHRFRAGGLAGADDDPVRADDDLRCHRGGARPARRVPGRRAGGRREPGVAPGPVPPGRRQQRVADRLRRRPPPQGVAPHARGGLLL